MDSSTLALTAQHAAIAPAKRPSTQGIPPKILLPHKMAAAASMPSNCKAVARSAPAHHLARAVGLSRRSFGGRRAARGLALQLRIAGRQLSSVALQLFELLAQLLRLLLSILQPCLRAMLCSKHEAKQAMATIFRRAS